MPGDQTATQQESKQRVGRAATVKEERVNSYPHSPAIPNLVSPAWSPPCCCSTQGTGRGTTPHSTAGDSVSAQIAWQNLQETQGLLHNSPGTEKYLQCVFSNAPSAGVGSLEQTQGPLI